MGRPRTFDPEEAIHAATRIFRSHGFAGATPALLAEAAGIGKGSLYHAFGSKHELFMTCLKRYAELEYQEFASQLAGPGTVRQRIRSVFDAAAAADAADFDRSGCLIVNTATQRGLSDAAASEVVWASMARTRAALRLTLAEGVRAGEIGPDRDLDALADMLQCTMIGLRVLGKAAPGAPSITAVIDTAMSNI